MKELFKKPRTDAQAHRQLWWGIFAIAIVLVVADLMYVAGAQ